MTINKIYIKHIYTKQQHAITMRIIASKMLMPTVILIILIDLIALGQQQHTNFPKSPCPSVFLYRYNGREWYGIINIINSMAIDRRSNVLRAIFSMRVTVSFIFSLKNFKIEVRIPRLGDVL